jgi:hypothetical protein
VVMVCVGEGEAGSRTLFCVQPCKTSPKAVWAPAD